MPSGFESIRIALSRLRALFRRGRLDRDLDDEVEAHLDLLAREYAQRGMSPEAARAAARRAFGGVEQMKEQFRDHRSLPALEMTVADLRYTARMLWKSPGFTLVAVLSLALGIGANLAVFTVINAMMLRTLPVPHPQDVVTVDSRYRGGQGVLSFPIYRDLRAQQTVFTDMLATAGETPVRLTILPPAGAGAVTGAGARAGSVAWTGEGAGPGAGTGPGVGVGTTGAGSVSIDNVRVSFVTASYFPVLGLQPALGRFFTEDEDRIPNSAETQGTVVVLSDGFWERQFGRDPHVIDRSVLVRGIPSRVIGVAPRGFTGELLGGAPDLWVPLVSNSSSNSLENRRGNFLDYMARLKPGVSREQAEAQMTLLFQQLLRAEQAAEPRTRADGPTKAVQDFTVKLQPGARGLDYSMRSTFATPLALVMTIVALVLLIACANVANLLLARAAARQREITLRLALGCARSRLVRQLLTESLLLAVLGTIAGASVAWWGGRSLLRLVNAPQLPSINLTPDIRVLAFAVAIVLFAGIAFGLAPALRTSHVDLAPALNDQSRGGTSRRVRQRLSRTLVIAQVALSLLLLIGAGLLVRSLRNLRAIDLGFRPESVLIFDLSGGLPRLGTGPSAEADQAATQATILRQAAERVRQIPGVQSASVASSVPFGTGDVRATLNILDAVSNAGGGDEPMSARFDFVSPGYIDTLGMRLLAGRGLEARDTLQTPAVAVINEALARRYFPSGNAIGRHMEIELPAIKVNAVRLRPMEIVGIVADAKYNDLRQQAQPMFYASIEQFPRSLRSLEIRTTLPAAALNGPVRQALLEVTGDIMIRRVMTLWWQIDSTLGTERFITGLCTFFGVLALLLASIGLYGVMAYGVSQRTNEIGIRMALGASRPSVLAMVLRQSLAVVAAGVALGLPLALLSTRALGGYLYGLSPADPLTLAAAVLTLLAVAGLAAYLPARKATKIDPMIALRYE